MITIYTIAICDDDPIFLAMIEKKTKVFFGHTLNDIDIFTFANGDSFFTSLNTMNYDLIMLDIDMPGKNGIEISKMLRIQNNEASIIFISNHESYVFQSLHYQPLRFIRKNYLDSELEEALTAFLKVSCKSEPLYTFNTVSTDRIIPIKDIMYLDVYIHKVTVHCTHDEFEIRKTLNFFQNELKPYGFIRIHKSYLVSYRFIYSINPTSVILTNHTELPISRGKNTHIKEQYMHYIRELS